jgi:hypothetical protein
MDNFIVFCLPEVFGRSVYRIDKNTAGIAYRIVVFRCGIIFFMLIIVNYADIGFHDDGRIRNVETANGAIFIGLSAAVVVK